MAKRKHSNRTISTEYLVSIVQLHIKHHGCNKIWYHKYKMKVTSSHHFTQEIFQLNDCIPVTVYSRIAMLGDLANFGS